MKTSDILAKIDALRKSDVKNFQTNYFLTPVEDECFVLENEKAIVFLSLEKDFYKYENFDGRSYEKIVENEKRLEEEGIKILSDSTEKIFSSINILLI